MIRNIIIFFSIFTSIIYACSGDCLSCHPTLSKSIEKPYHTILNSCITCHKDLSDVMSECGGDCFACHSKEKLIGTQLAEHQQLSKCKECHINKEDLLKFPQNDFSSNLKDLLK